jgi:two-component system, NarL family, invasion response regulator UvrY
MMRILIADDHFTVRTGLEMMVKDIQGDACLTEQAHSGDEVLFKLQAAPYDMLILDMNMPGPSGFQLLAKVLQVQRHLRVLVVSMNSEDFFSLKCFQLGAHGFIAKNASDEELRKAIEAVMNRKSYISKFLTNEIVNNLSYQTIDVNPLKSLSARELDVTMLLLKGKGVLEISNTLSITSSTASTFKGRIFRKLGVTSLLELGQLARRSGLIDDNPIQH